MWPVSLCQYWGLACRKPQFRIGLLSLIRLPQVIHRLTTFRGSLCKGGALGLQEEWILQGTIRSMAAVSLGLLGLVRGPITIALESAMQMEALREELCGTQGPTFHLSLNAASSGI